MRSTDIDPSDPADLPLPALVAVILTGVASVMVAGLKPLLVTLYITHVGLGAALAGLLLTIEMVAATAGAAAVAVLTARMSRRTLAMLALAGLVASNLVAMLPMPLPVFAAVRALAGASEGVAAATMAAAVAGTRNPEKLMGGYMAFALIIMAAAFAMSPLLVAHWGIASIFLTLAAVSLVALLASRSFPDVAASAPTSASPRLALPAGARAVLAGTALFYLALGGVWPFVGEIGRAAGRSTGTIATILSVAQLVAAVACLTPAWIGGTRGRTQPLAIALLVSFVATLGLLVATALYGVAAPLFLGGSMLFFTYLMGVISNLDPLGRVSSLSFAVQTIALGIGPAWGGLVIQHFGYPALLAAGLATIAGAALVLLPLARRQDRARAPITSRPGI